MTGRVTGADVAVVLAKLGELAETLPDDERRALAWIVTRARSLAEAEVTGHCFHRTETTAAHAGAGTDPDPGSELL